MKLLALTLESGNNKL